MCKETLLVLINGCFTIYFGIVGLALTAYGAFSSYTILVINSEEIIQDLLTILPSAFTVILGLILILLVFLGCCAVCREHSCCLETYSIILVILSVIHVGLGVYCIIVYGDQMYNGKLKARISQDLSDEVRQYQINPGRMDGIQRLLQCCGNEDAERDYSYYHGLPPSCCDDSVSCFPYSPAIYRNGCGEQVFLFTVGTNYYLGWISVIVAATELIGGLLGICLSCCIWRKQVSSW